MSIFVDDEDMVKLTGFRSRSRQIQQLRSMGVPFRINGAGHPMVAISAIEGGRSAAAPPREKVVPNAFRQR